VACRTGFIEGRLENTEMKIDTAVLDVLANATTEGHSLTLNGTLDRNLYIATNKVLELAGGKWIKKEKAHLFDGDASEVMDQIILSGEISNKKQELGYFPTPAAVVNRLVELAKIESDMVVLEPSAGRGAIALELSKVSAGVDCVEIDPSHLAALSSAQSYRYIEIGDFLALTPKPIYDRVVMNPPFAKNVAPKHVLHAAKFLKRGGKLVSVMPSSVMYRSDEWNKSIRREVVDIEPLPDNSFAESGTNVSTVIVTLQA